MNFFLPVATLWRRELVRFFRQPSRIIGALGTPLIFWLVIGSGLGESFRPPSYSSSIHYLEYFYPGTILLIVLFTSIFSSISIIEDRKEGFLLSVLVAPVSRSALVLGKLLGGTSIAFLQGMLLVLLAPWLGISLSLEKILWLGVTLFLISFSLTGLGFVFAWKIDSTQGFHGVMNLLLFPMWLLSGAVFPPAGASTWVRWIMYYNPLTYGFSAIRHIFYQDLQLTAAGLPPLPTSFAVTILFGVVIFAISFLLAQQRSLRA